MEFLQTAPVASFIFAITILTTLMAFSNEELKDKLIFHPYSVSKGQQVYTLITSGLIHGDWMHLIFNMLAFSSFAFGREGLEAQIGHWQFAVLYFASLILCHLPSVVKHRDDYSYRSLGASGAISAVVFSAILFAPMNRLMIMPIPVQIPAVIFGVLYLVYCSYASKYARDNIGHDAHLFGALSGVLLTVLMVPGIITIFLNQLHW